MSVNSSNLSWVGLWRATGHGAWALLSVMGIAALAVAALVFLLKVPLGITEETFSQPEFTLGLYAAQYGIGLFVLLLVPVVLHKKTREQLRSLFGVLRSPKLKDFGLAMLAFVPYFALSYLAQIIITAAVPGFNADQSQDVGFSDISGTLQLVVAFMALVVLAPLAEELIFRGYLFGSAREGLGFWPAAIITSALFGLVHGQWNVGIDTFVLSMVLCYLRERTGSIWAGVGLHALKNCLAFTLLFIFSVG